MTNQENELADGIKRSVTDGTTTYIDKILARLLSEGRLSFSIPVKITPTREGKFQVEARINLVESRIKDTFVTVVDLKQLPLPGMEKRYKIEAAHE